MRGVDNGLPTYMFVILKNCLKGWLGVPGESFPEKAKAKRSTYSGISIYHLKTHSVPPYISVLLNATKFSVISIQ